jgi:SAM-dependent methyltransferase
MAFSVQEALPYLRCPLTGDALTLAGDHLTAPDGQRYPIVDGIPDLTVQDSRRVQSSSDYDGIAGLRYNLFIFNPLTMAFTWGLGVLKVPVLMRPARELAAGVFLDVPCGTGIFTARAYRHSTKTRILAMDFSMGMLRAARRRAVRLGVDNAVFIRADVAKLPIADACLDGCLSMAGFHVFPDPAEAAVQLGRVLKSGAKVTASIACSGERRISDMMIERVMKPRGYFHQGLPERTYRAFFERGGFARVDAKMAGAVAIVRGVKA